MASLKNLIYAQFISGAQGQFLPTSTLGTTVQPFLALDKTPGTYTKVTIDSKGIVTTGTTLTSTDLPTYTGSVTSTQVTNALGYTPYNATNPDNYISASTAASTYLPLTGGTLTGNLAISATGSITIPVGTTAQRPTSPSDGMLRYNTTTAQFEGYTNNIWGSIAGGGTSSAKAFYFASF